MENMDLGVLRKLHGWRAGGQHAILVTVVRTWGSSPRPVGSIMAMCDDGSLAGSVSGGCVEDDLIARYAHAASDNRSLRSVEPDAPVFLKYGITADEAHRFGLPCGGTLELLLESDPDADTLEKLIDMLESGRLVRRRSSLKDGAVSLQLASAPTLLELDDDQVTNTFGPEYRMLLIGGGQLTEYLATMALFSGFAVTVCDPRVEYRASFQVPGAQLVSDMPDDVVTAFKPDSHTCVVALTHDPKLDDLALLEALETDAFYVGAIGSRRNQEARRERMSTHFGKNAATLSRLKGPAGIYIGSKTPPEIAVSIMAEIIAVKNGVVLPREVDVSTAKTRRSGLV
ncbi:MAG: XdhC family protein [Pseudomonadota bacterium]